MFKTFFICVDINKELLTEEGDRDAVVIEFRRNGLKVNCSGTGDLDFVGKNGSFNMDDDEEEEEVKFGPSNRD